MFYFVNPKFVFIMLDNNLEKQIDKLNFADFAVLNNNVQICSRTKINQNVLKT